MSERSFADILGMPLNQIETPKALPVGTYPCIVKGQPEITQIGPNKTDCVIFNLEPVQAGTDVDQSQLREVLNGEALLDRKIVHRMFVTDKSKHRIKKFLADDLGIDGTFSLRQSINEAMGRQVYVKLIHEPAKDGSAVYENIASTSKV